MVYYQHHLNLNRLWLEQLMYQECLQVVVYHHVLSRLCPTVRYGLMNCSVSGQNTCVCDRV
jgi:hypothetical protein